MSNFNINKLHAKLLLDKKEQIYMYFVFTAKEKDLILGDYNEIDIYIPQLFSDKYFWFSDYKCDDILGLYNFTRKIVEYNIVDEESYTDLDYHFELSVNEDDIYIELDLEYGICGLENYIHLGNIKIEHLEEFNKELLKALSIFTGYTIEEINEQYNKYLSKFNLSSINKKEIKVLNNNITNELNNDLKNEKHLCAIATYNNYSKKYTFFVDEIIEGEDIEWYVEGTNNKVNVLEFKEIYTKDLPVSVNKMKKIVLNDDGLIGFRNVLDYSLYPSDDTDIWWLIIKHVKEKYNVNFKVRAGNCGDAAVAVFELDDKTIYIWNDCFIDETWIESDSEDIYDLIHELEEIIKEYDSKK